MKSRLGAVVLVFLIAADGSVSAQKPIDQALQRQIERLLLTYRDFKTYPDASAADVDKRLGDDRRAVFQAVLRASFIPLTPDRPGQIPPGARLIDYIEAVHGIWGVRVGDGEGRNQFRLSVKFRRDVREHLEAARERDGSLFFSCHVLLPEASGGDDASGFSGFRRARDPICQRSSKEAYRRIQVSYRRSDPAVGEIDLDFDAGDCHTQPSNSDVRALADDHLDLLNQAHAYFSTGLKLACQIRRFHCASAYADANCP